MSPLKARFKTSERIRLEFLSSLPLCGNKERTRKNLFQSHPLRSPLLLLAQWFHCHTHYGSKNIPLPYVWHVSVTGQLKYISFTGAKAYPLWDAGVCILATEDTCLIIWWGGIITHETLPQALEDMWCAPAGRWASAFTAVWFLHNTWKGLQAVDHVKKNGISSYTQHYCFLV